MNLNRLGSFLALWIALVLLSVGCSGTSKQAGTPTPSNQSTVARSSLLRNTAPQVSDADLAAAVEGNTRFGLKLFPLIDTDPDSNLVFSPYSITQAFALLAPGARANTLTQIEQAMCFLPQDRLNPALNKLDLLISQATTGAVVNGTETPRLSVANAVWGQQGFPLFQTYLDTLAVNFGAGLHEVDFMHDQTGSRQSINNWVSDQTNGRIQDLIPPEAITVYTRVVLTNAIYFKAAWAEPFSSNATANQTFYNRSGTLSSVPFMNSDITASFAQTGGCRAVDIPYAGGMLSMLLIMPEPGTFDTFLSTLTPEVLAQLTGSLTNANVRLSVPKFTFTAAPALDTPLKGLGITDAYAPDFANLSGITDQARLKVDSAVHKAFIAVDEKGTEAAAATGITIGTTAVHTIDATITIDHPFLFMIRDRATGLILFMGKVVSLP